MPRKWTDEQRAEARIGWLKRTLKQNNIAYSETDTAEVLEEKYANFKGGGSQNRPTEGKSIDDQRFERQEQEMASMRRQMQALVDNFKKEKGDVPQELLDPNEVLEEEVVLFSNMVARTLDHKIVNGHIVRTPSGKPFVFKTASNIPDKNAEGEIVGMKITSICRITTKRDRDWVLGNPATNEVPHADYGIFFWRSATEAMSVKTRDLEMIQRTVTYLRGLKERDILRLAQEHGIPISSGRSAHEYTLPLAKVITDKTIAQERDAHNIELARHAKELTAAIAQ